MSFSKKIWVDFNSEGIFSFFDNINAILFYVLIIGIFFFFDNIDGILFHLLFVQEDEDKNNIAHSELNSTHFIVHCSTTAKISH